MFSETLFTLRFIYADLSHSCFKKTALNKWLITMTWINVAAPQKTIVILL